jgi:hypothetical protein
VNGPGSETKQDSDDDEREVLARLRIAVDSGSVEALAGPPDAWVRGQIPDVPSALAGRWRPGQHNAQ